MCVLLAITDLFLSRGTASSKFPVNSRATASIAKIIVWKYTNINALLVGFVKKKKKKRKKEKKRKCQMRPEFVRELMENFCRTECFLARFACIFAQNSETNTKDSLVNEKAILNSPNNKIIKFY